jgi:hypothetical protein
MDPVSVMCPIKIMRAGSDARVTVKVMPHKDNRMLRVRLESELFERSSDEPLDGDDAALTHVLMWRSLPPGDYVVEAIVFGTARTPTRAKTTFVVF